MLFRATAGKRFYIDAYINSPNTPNVDISDKIKNILENYTRVL